MPHTVRIFTVIETLVTSKARQFLHYNNDSFTDHCNRMTLAPLNVVGARS